MSVNKPERLCLEDLPGSTAHSSPHPTQTVAAVLSEWPTYRNIHTQYVNNVIH